MGNVQASSIVNQLLPFESYINDVPELKFSYSLGSTRFMKVARAEHAEGSIVIKVFVLVDQSFLIDLYCEQVLQIRKRLLKFPNCCPFTQVYTTNRCAILCRSFAKYTLYDRLNTRPFLLDIEKKWIIFQLLKSLSQCRIAMVCHGDLKTENILVSSSLWIQITDFASFKPSFLPYDNPSTFTFFFDTSRRRCCNLAPERFKKSDEIPNYSRLPGDFFNISEGLTESMDIFAMGCVIVELLTDGRQIAFTLPQAIDYNRMDEHSARLYLQKILNEVSNEFYSLLTVMLDRDPIRRRNEFLKLLPCNSALFPLFFETYLYRYLKDFFPSMTPDGIITKLYIEKDNYLSQLKANNNKESVLLFINYVTSNLRSCRSLSSKMDAISLLHQFAKIWPSIIGDRIIPYLTYLVTDYFSQIRAESIFVLTEILSLFEPTVQEECRLLIDYIFPKLKLITIDFSNHVKSALAKNIGKLAMISLRFMEEAIKKIRVDNDDEILRAHTKNNHENEQEFDVEESEKILIKSEKEVLQTVVSELFVNLCGSDNEVRRCLFESSNLEILCRFFGLSRATDVLMHMITVLNDKPDWRMRATFYESCPVVAKYLGQSRCGKLLPFLQQGLQDCQEYVVYGNLYCIYLLCDQKLLPKFFICEIMRDVIPFLVHPNKWLRIAVVNILVVLQSTFNVSDFYCKIAPLVRNYLNENLIMLNDREIVYESLKSPIPRQIWEFITDFSNTAYLINVLENRRTLYNIGAGNRDLMFITKAKMTNSSNTFLLPNEYSLDGKNINFYSINNSSLEKSSSNAIAKNETNIELAIKKLINLGLDEFIEEKVLAFKNILSKAKSVESFAATCQSIDFSNVHLADFPNVRRYIFDMENGTHLLNFEHKDIFENSAHNLVSMSASGLLDLKINLLGTQIYNYFDEKKVISNINFCRGSSRFLLEDTLNHEREKYFEQKRVTIALNNSEIVKHIATAVSNKMNDGNEEFTFRNGINPFLNCDSNTLNSSPTFTLNSISDKESENNVSKEKTDIKLLLHIHEHSEKISQLTLHPDKNHFASCSYDKTIKLWSAAALLNNSHPSAFSSDTLRYSHKINACSFMNITGNLAIASDDGQLQVFDVQHKRLLKTHRLDVENEGVITQIYTFGQIIYALTHQSYVYCFDLRLSKASRTGISLEPIWKQKPKNSFGLLTSFCIDNVNQHWMFLCGSSATSKNLMLWDLRFGGLEVTSWANSSQQVIPLKCWSIARNSNCSEVFTSSTKEGEVSLWDLSTQSRTDVFWPTTIRPFTYSELVTSALISSCIDPEIIYTGDSEGSLRCWNLRYNKRSNYLCGPYRKFLLTAPEVVPVATSTNNNLTESQSMSYFIRYNSIKFRNSLLKIQTEERVKVEAKPKKDISVSLQVSDYHHDSITDLLSIWPDLLVSAGKNGVIKMWKSYL